MNGLKPDTNKHTSLGLMAWQMVLRTAAGSSNALLVRLRLVKCSVQLSYCRTTLQKPPAPRVTAPVLAARLDRIIKSGAASSRRPGGAGQRAAAALRRASRGRRGLKSEAERHERFHVFGKKNQAPRAFPALLSTTAARAGAPGPPVLTSSSWQQSTPVEGPLPRLVAFQRCQ